MKLYIKERIEPFLYFSEGQKTLQCIYVSTHEEQFLNKLITEA